MTRFPCSAFLALLSTVCLIESLSAQETHRSVEEIEEEWKNFATFQKSELISFCDFLYDEGYYERAILAYFRFVFLYPEDEMLPVVYYRIARNYEELTNIALAKEYFEKVLAESGPNSTEYIAAKYRLAYLDLLEGNYEAVMANAQGTSDPYLLAFDGYAKFSQFKWHEAKQSFLLAKERFDTEEYDDVLTSLVDACDVVSVLPQKSKRLAGLLSIVPGGGRAYLRDWFPAAGTFVTTLGLVLQFAGGNSTVISGLALGGIYGGSIWGSIIDVEYANHQIVAQYAEEIRQEAGPENFLDFPEPEYLSLE